MPQAPFNICSLKSCTILVPAGRTRCDKHQKKSWEGARGNSYGPDWPRMQKQVMREEHYCRQCKVRRTVFADHITPTFEGGQTVRENLQGLCRRCHSIKTTREAARAAAAKANTIRLRTEGQHMPSRSTTSEQAEQETEDKTSVSASASELEDRRKSRRNAAA